MPQIVNKKSVLEMAMGAIAEITDYEVERVVANIMDPNTNATAKRKITITLTFAPDDYGYMAAVLEQSILRGWEGLFALKDDFVDAVPTQRPASTEDRPREIGPDTDILDFL